jgi:hypothetical protein
MVVPFNGGVDIFSKLGHFFFLFFPLDHNMGRHVPDRAAIFFLCDRAAIFFLCDRAAIFFCVSPASLY